MKIDYNARFPKGETVSELDNERAKNKLALKQVETAARQLRERFGSEFHGLVVWGSRVTGRSRKESDLDLVLVHSAVDAGKRGEMIGVIKNIVKATPVDLTPVNSSEPLKFRLTPEDMEHNERDPLLLHAGILSGLGMGNGNKLTAFRVRLAQEAAGQKLWGELRDVSKQQWIEPLEEYLREVSKVIERKRKEGYSQEELEKVALDFLSRYNKVEDAKLIARGKPWGKRINPLVRKNPAVLENLALPKTAVEYIAALKGNLNTPEKK